MKGCVAPAIRLDVFMLFIGRTDSTRHSPDAPSNQHQRLGIFFSCLLALGLTQLSVQSADWDAAEKVLLKGNYEECIRLAKDTLKERYPSEEWSILLTKAQLEVGHYADARSTITNALTRHRRSLPVRVLTYDVFRQNGQTESAKETLSEINEIASMRRSLSSDPATVVALGRAALLLGADPRQVLENFFHQVKKAEPKFRETYLAIGQLALDKNDDAMAAKNFQEGLKLFPSDADLYCGLAKAYLSSDRAKMVENLEAALEHNSKHTPSLLQLADHLIDAEEYEEADKQLEKVLAINPSHPEAWAYRAVLAHFNNDSEKEAQARERALQPWKTNPGVAHLIGRKLSQKYRFAEGSAYQRQAVKWEEDFLPAKIQLSQDLLRLGNDDEGWKLAEEVFQKDQYDITAYNLVTLHDGLSKFATLTNRDFILHMHANEAAIYGQRALELLTRAKASVCPKYGMEPEQPTIVEIFPEQKDFAVRTFGMPGGEGYLGVCFGRVITANSPKSQAANPASWEAVLWHEFCHVVTLGLTKNKMPRWLSEGISVFEERKANPAWGQAMTPKYREMILKDELTPVGELSGAFLTPKDGLHLQFAYYESSLVVEFLVERFGLDSLKKILRDLGEGKPINETLEAHTAPLKKIEKDFEGFARQRAEELGHGLEWKQPDGEDLAQEDDKWMDRYPKNYWVLTRKAKKLLAQKKWQDAKAPIQTLLDQYPDQSGPDNAYVLLASAHRGLNETNLERQALNRLAQLDADATDAFLRLMELASETQDWPAVAANAERYLAVNPLVPPPHRYLARACEALHKPKEAIAAYEVLLRLDPADLTDVHFRLAKLLHAEGNPAAKRHVLQALEEAPRFREAHRLLLSIAEKPVAPAKPPAEARPSVKPEAETLPPVPAPKQP